MPDRHIEVFFSGAKGPQLVGTAFFHGYGKRLRTSFSYSPIWLGDSAAFSLSPQAPLSAGTMQSQGLIGFLSDAAPDRWGRHLIYRGIQDAARTQRSAMRMIDDVDYLLGVDDWARMGALRFSNDGGETFLGEGTDVPKLVRLPELLHASSRVAMGTDGWQEIKTLLEAGSSSLGGARPKATVVDGDVLMLAKFPSAHDEWRVITWEAWALAIAERAGLHVPHNRLEHIGDTAVLVEERFDRRGQNRIAYMSALCALGLNDGQESDYADLGDAVRMLSAHPKEDLRELFGRMALNIALHNTDDHLRNHGFIRTNDGWRLSPAFDVNPNPFLDEPRVLSVYGESGREEVFGLMECGEAFGLSAQEMRAVIKCVVGSFAYWEDVARRLGCPEREIAMFAPVFEERFRALRA